MPKNPWGPRLPALWAEQKGCCAYCGIWTMMVREARHLPGVVLRPHTFWWGGRVYRIASVEHLLPRCVGGTNRFTNLVMVCTKCNNVRGRAMQTGGEEREGAA